MALHMRWKKKQFQRTGTEAVASTQFFHASEIKTNVVIIPFHFLRHDEGLR